MVMGVAVMASQVPTVSPQAANHADLIHAIAYHHDREAFTTLFHYYAPRLKQFFLKSGVESGAAEDLVQETMVSVWQSASLYDAKRASVATWLFTIARRRRADWLRKKMRTPLTVDDAVQFSDSQELAPSEGMSREEQETMVTALKDLPAEQYNVIYDAFFEGKTHDDIAKKYRLPLGTVKSRIRLAFEKLKRKL
jgi:RNA polymerase sigma-70 factor (ECF subfamily)